MKRMRDCFEAQVVPEAKLILLAMTGGRLTTATTFELSDLCGLDIGEVSEGANSLRIARINTSKTTGQVILAGEWCPESKRQEVKV